MVNLSNFVFHDQQLAFLFDEVALPNEDTVLKVLIFFGPSLEQLGLGLTRFLTDKEHRTSNFSSITVSCQRFKLPLNLAINAKGRITYMSLQTA
jgi:hypothetical protein